MTSSVRAALTALAASAACVAAVSGASAETAGNAAPDAPKWMQRWVSDRSAMLDARLAGLKAGLKLTPDQENLWGPFEAAIRDFAQARMARMQGMMERAEKDEEGPDMGGPPSSPLDRLDRMATRLSDVGAALKKIADAGKPLYASLDDQQKRMFGFLSREMMRMGRGHGGMGPMMGPPHHRGGEGDDETDDE